MELKAAFRRLLNWGRVSDPLTALSGSQHKAPGFAGGYLLLMDISMPDMDGIEATRRIRALGAAAARVPIIALTAHIVTGYRERCLEAGMNDFAAKPISKVNLLKIVNEWLSRGIDKIGSVQA